MTLRAFTGYLNSTLFGAANVPNNATFDTTSDTIQMLVEDGAGDEFIEGDAAGGSVNTEDSEDAENDQFVYIQDSTGTVLADGALFFLELSFTFSINGQSFTGYQFQIEGGFNFTVLPPGVPDGVATVTSRDFSPTPDLVEYTALSSSDEVIDQNDFPSLNLSGSDEILGGAGDDTITAGAGEDEVEGGTGNDTIDGGSESDVIYGDNRLDVNGRFDSNQADGDFSFGSVEGWFNTGSGGTIERWGDGFLGTNTADGSTFVELDVNSGGGLDHLQTSLELETGVEYFISIDHAARSGGGVNDDFEITHNGTVIATISPSSIGSFTTTSLTLTGLAGTDTIGFRELAGQNNSLGVLLDNFTVQLSEASVAASPDSFDDVIDGGDGDDTIYGQQGGDQITGGEGDDVLSGGLGDDILVFADGSGSDIILDFEIGSDLLDVSGLNDADGNAVNTGDVTITSDGQGGSIATFSNGEQIILRNIDPDDLDTPAELNAIGIPCFVSGTLIETREGPCPVEDLTPGDMVKVGPDQFAPLRANLSRELPERELEKNPCLLPIRIEAGALGSGLPLRDLWVSRQHRMLVVSRIAERMFDGPEALIAAIRLTALPGIAEDATRRGFAYHHLVFDVHQIVYAEGAPSESFLTGPEGLKALSEEARTEVHEIFPDLAAAEFAMEPARFVPPGKRQKALIARHQKNARPILERC